MVGYMHLKNTINEDLINAHNLIGSHLIMQKTLQNIFNGSTLAMTALSLMACTTFVKRMLEQPLKRHEN
jgi:hypothetical protein